MSLTYKLKRDTIEPLSNKERWDKMGKTKESGASTKAPKQKRDFTGVKRAIYILAFACMLSISAYFGIMVSNPDLGQKVMGGFALASAVHYFVLAIK